MPRKVPTITLLILATLWLESCQPLIDDDQVLPFNWKVLNTFGQLDHVLLSTDVKPNVTLEIDPPGLELPALVSGIARFNADLNGMQNCIVVTMLSGTDIPVDVQMELEQMDPGLQIIGPAKIAFCNFENDAGELRAKVEQLFTDAFTRTDRSDSAATAAERFLDPSLDPDKEYQQVEIWSDHPQHGTSLLGPMTDDKLQIAAYHVNVGNILDGGSLPPELNADNDPNLRTFFNPLPLFAAYLRNNPVIAQPFIDQRPFVDGLAIESAQALDFSAFVSSTLAEGTNATKSFTGKVRIRLKLEENDAGSLDGPTVVPYEASYTLTQIEATGETLRASGGGHFKKFNTHLAGANLGDPDVLQGPLIAEKLYSAKSIIVLDTYWIYLPIDQSELLPTDPVWKNMTDKTLATVLDLSALDTGGSRVFPVGEYRLSVSVKEPFSNIDDIYVSHFNVTANVLQPSLDETTSRYFNHDVTATAGSNWRFDYAVSGIGTFDRIDWRVLRKSDSAVIDSGTVMGNAVTGSFNWQPGALATIPDPDFYELELTVKDGTTSKGVEKFDITIYRMSITPVPSLGFTGRASPGVIVPVNNDDDNANGIPDSSDNFTAEDDLVRVSINIEPTIPGDFTIKTNISDPATQPIRVWNNNQKSVEKPLPVTVDTQLEAPPYLVFLEGKTSGIHQIRLQHQTTDGQDLTSDPYALTIVSIEIMEDTNNDHAITATDNTILFLRISRWDDAYDAFPAFATFNNADTHADRNFVERDPRRFYIRITDPTANQNTAVAESITTQIETLPGIGSISDNATDAVLIETGINTGVFVSRSQLLTAEDQVDGSGVLQNPDDKFPAHDGAVGIVADDLGGDRTHRTSIDGIVQVTYSIVGLGFPIKTLAPVCQRGSNDERRKVEVRVIVYNEPFKDTGFDHDGNPATPDIGAGNGTFDYIDSNVDMNHDAGEPSEQYRDLSSGSGGTTVPLRHGNNPLVMDGRGALISQMEIDQQIKRAEIAWAPACITVVQIGSTTFTEAPSIFFGMLNILLDGTVDWPGDFSVIFDKHKTVTTPTEVTAIFAGPLAGANATSFSPDINQTAIGHGEDLFFVSRVNLAIERRTMAHELGHLLTNRDDLPNTQPIFFPAETTFLDNTENSYRRFPQTTEQMVRTERPAGNLTHKGNRLLKSR
ncbi:MAG: hypothetical protein GY896_06565 [Gammaproteobacteria bacterium]|nr:hypothetical protein [Gammaproteobacteria bacterium]